eukprot:GHVU01073174.1.p2 GENE.GHVU01073174.1~~GHVU01073174.1.p2  ORF type:complete len:101 (+),score=14.96 GHVU01073174.1:1143-1445(+)
MRAQRPSFLVLIDICSESLLSGAAAGEIVEQTQFLMSAHEKEWKQYYYDQSDAVIAELNDELQDDRLKTEQALLKYGNSKEPAQCVANVNAKVAHYVASE